MPKLLEIKVEVRAPKGDKTSVGDMRKAGGILEWIPKSYKLVDTTQRGAGPDDTITTYRFTE